MVFPEILGGGARLFDEEAARRIVGPRQHREQAKECCPWPTTGYGGLNSHRTA